MLSGFVMTQRLFPLVSLLAASTLAFGCSGSGGGGGTGGTGGDETLDCSFEACGGDLVGTWTARGICPSGESLMDDYPACDDRVLEGEPEFSGTFTFGADGSFSRDTLLGGDFHHEYDDDCIAAVTDGALDAAAYCAVLGNSASRPDSPYSGTCTAADGLCICDLTTHLELTGTGTFAVTGSALAIDGGPGNEFCVSGDELKILQGDGSVVVFRR